MASAPIEITSTATPGTTAVAPDASVIDGMFDVGGHELYMNCVGSGPPTIVYIHGYIEDDSYSGASSATQIQAALSDRYRFCRYDRRNVGLSDEVPGMGDGETAVADLHSLLAAAEVESPYVILGASFGGLISYLYAATYPDEVAGMVLLDSSFPGELDLEALFPEEDRWTHEMFDNENEKLDQLAAYEQAQGLAPPEIPVTYLLATPSTWELGVPEYDAVVLDRIKEYAEGFSPGVLKEVQSPHFMEASVPETIVEELLKVIETAAS